MTNLDLFNDLLTKYIDTLESYNLVRSLNKYNFKKQPISALDLATENKKILGSNLELVTTSGDNFIHLYPKHYVEHLKAYASSSPEYPLTSYKLMDTLYFLFSDSVSMRGELTYYLSIDKKYQSFDSLMKTFYDGNTERALTEGLANIDRLKEEFKADYDTLLKGKDIYETYKVLFNDVTPTGDYKALVKLLKDNNIPKENLTRLEKVDGTLLHFAKLKLNIGHIDYSKRTGFVYYFSGSIYYDDSFYGNPTVLSKDLDYQIKYLTDVKAEADLADKIINELKKIKNVNYFVK